MANVVVDNVAADENGLTHVRQLRGDGVSIVEAPDGTLSAPLPGAVLEHDHFVPVDDQAEFELSFAPFGEVLFYINGMLQNEPDFTVVGRLLTWLGHGFSITHTDYVDAVYTA